MSLRLLAALLAAALLGGGAMAADAPKPAPSSERADVVICAETRPLIVGLQVQIDGKPLAVAWDEFVRHVHQTFDTDRDGVLTEVEVGRMAPPRLLFTRDFFNDFQPPTASTVDNNPADGIVSLTELSDYLRRNDGAFQVRPGREPSLEMALSRRGAANPEALASALNDALFVHLDTNKDGKLSRHELTAAADVLLKADTDEDELVTPQELLPNFQQIGREAQAVPAPGAAPIAPSLSFMLGKGTSPLKSARQLQARYTRKDRQGDRKLVRKDLGLDETAFRELDADQDEALDTEELTRFFRRSADLELTARLGKEVPAGTTLSVVEDRSSPLNSAVRLSTRGVLVVDLGTSRLDWRTRSEGSESSYGAENVKEIFRGQFAAGDKNGDGQLDAKEAAEANFFRNSFETFDRDRDGKLAEKEMLDFLDLVQSLQDRAQSACATLYVSDQGRGMFDLLDANRDGGLGVRELRAATQRLESLLRDDSEGVGKAAFPRNYRLTLKQGPAGGGQFRGLAALAMLNKDMRSTEAGPGPAWFRKMDRNRDGDISRREFIGPPEGFARLDADGDGLIDADEADRFTRSKQPPKVP